MRKLRVFNFVTLNGFFEGPNRDIGWHRHGAEENAYSAEALEAESTLLFGRVTYQMMASWWPTPQAIASDPLTANRMNAAEKIVFSRTLDRAEWGPTEIVRQNIQEEVKRLKQLPGNDMTILGSGTILTQLAESGLVDEYEIMIDPVALGEGRSIFAGVKKKLDLRLVKSRVFESGTVLLCYRPLEG